MRHGYPWVPTDQAHGRPRQVGPAYQKTRRPDGGPNRPSWWPTRPPEDLPEDSKTTLSRTTSRLGVQDKIAVDSDKQTDVYGNGCNQLDLGLLVVTDQESGQPTLSAGQYKAGRVIPCNKRNPQAIYTNNWT